MILQSECGTLRARVSVCACVSVRPDARVLQKKEARVFETLQMPCLLVTDPLFNGGHWIPDMMDIAGADYSMTTAKERSGKLVLMH